MALAIIRFFWRHKAATLIFLCLSGAFIWLGTKFSGARRQNQDYLRQLQSYEVVTQIHEGAYLAQTARLDLAETLIREYSPQPGTQVAYQAEAKIIYKTRTVKVPVIETRIEYRDKVIEITGTAPEGCPDGDIDLSYTLAPLKFDLFVTRIKGEYQTIVDTHNSDLAVEMKTRLDPAVFKDEKRWFAGAGPLVRLHASADDYSIYDAGLAVEAGYLFSRWYVKGQAQWLGGFGVGVIFGGRF